MSMIPQWNEHSCIRCVACVGSCPEGAMRYSNNRILIIEKECIRCGRCIALCPLQALSRGGE